MKMPTAGKVLIMLDLKKDPLDLTLYPYDHASEYELYPRIATVLCQMLSSQLYECEQCD